MIALTLCRSRLLAVSRFRHGGRNDVQVLTARELAHTLAKRSSQASKRNDEGTKRCRNMHVSISEANSHAQSAMTKERHGGPNLPSKFYSEAI